jgi:hypothetical protein
MSDGERRTGSRERGRMGCVDELVGVGEIGRGTVRE